MMEKTCGNCGNPCGRENCGFWEPNNEVLEQRYQQIVKVARDLFNRAYEFNRDGPCLGGIYIADFREKLEELGVEV